MSRSGSAMSNVTGSLTDSLTSKSPPTYRSIQFPSDLKGDEDKTTSESSSYRQLRYKVYPWRWFMLLSLCFLNVSNGMMWLTFAPIPDFTASYYNVQVSDVDWFSMSFFAFSLVIGFVSIFILNSFGLKVSVYAGAIFNASGACLRVISAIEPVICSQIFGKSGFLVAMLGQILTACAQPFLLYTPTTLASLWFGPKERAVATGLSSLANPVGIAVVQLTSPYIVTSVSKVPMMLWVYAIPAVVGLVLTLIAFWYKEPPSPPASSANRESVLPFFTGLKKIVMTPMFWVLMVVWGGGSGMFNALLTLLPQILCPYGYSDQSSGLWGSLMIFAGMLGAFIAGLIIDYSKAFKEVAVVAYSFATLSFVWFFEVFFRQRQDINIAFSLCVFGFFALPLIPACMELGVEITYPVSEVTSSGLLWSAAQVVGILLVLISQFITSPLSPHLVDINKCGDSSSHNDTSLPSCFQPSSNSSTPSFLTKSTQLYDSTNILYMCLALTVANLLVLVLCFWPKYRRVESEKRSSFEKSVVVRS